ncbi:uncharacterized protein LOC114444595 isoform X3 [Parambassis ranga]|uniref:Uncharacterized protein LOC114444595 isoform X3 n=1 Tax=Parambassis ranga TaxID=210632 RepID=A0A6P7JE51_9TELE|nr:uncharacterized protein LOC114444595 isoform X3 [Parambassis ranga]
MRKTVWRTHRVDMGHRALLLLLPLWISVFSGSKESLGEQDLSQSVKCPVSAAVDVVFLVDGSGSVSRQMFKDICRLISAAAGAFQIGENNTRVGLVQFSTDARTEFNLKDHLTRPALLHAISSLSTRGGGTNTGNALNYVFKNSFTEEAGARTGFPKVLVIITDGESTDAVEGYARLLRKMGVKIFVVAINNASKEEIQLMASTPHSSHIVWIDHIDKSHNEERNLITLVCTCVDEQLNTLISREVVEPASNLQVQEVASKSMRLTWDASIGDISAYKVQLIPRMADSKLQDLYVGPTQTTVIVRDLAPDTEYQISLFALKRLTPSEPVTAMQKTEPVQVSLECSLDVDVKADVVLFVDGSYSIGLAKVRAFLEVLVNTFNIGPDKVQISLIQNCMDPHAEFYLNTHHDLNAVVKAVRTFSYRGGSTNASKALNHVRETIFQSSRGSRPNVPRVIILITDGQLSDDFEDPATRLRNADVDIFAVGVKDAVRSELEAIATEPVETHVFTVEDFDGFHRISKELTQSICHNIYQRQLLQPKTLSFSEVSTRSFRASWEIDVNMVESFLVRFEPADDADSHYMSMSVPGDTLTALLPQLTPMTRYKVNIYAQYEKGDSLPVTGHETTLKGLCADNTQSPTETDEVRLVGGASRCAGRLEVKEGEEWRAEWFSERDLKAATAVCRQLDCGSVLSIEAGSYPYKVQIHCSDSVRLVEGTNMCSGRLEVKSDQSWSSVCEDDFNLQNAEVVCRELSCGAPSVFKGRLYGAAEAPVWMRRFQCGGHESALLDCGSSQSTENSCSAGKAVGLTCSDPDDVRLVGGANRCSGRLELKHNGEWREVDISYSDWTLKEAAVVCRWLDCGAPASTSGRKKSLKHPVWKIIPDCVQSESMIKDCVVWTSGKSSSLEMSCSDSVRLVEGTNVCSGRLEVKSDQSWSSVCEDDFNLQNAEVVCRELGCGAPSVLQGALYGAVEPLVWSTEFQCEGNESALLDCDRTSSARSSCSAGKAVGLTCSDNIRLVGENSRCAGDLEVNMYTEWRPVGVDGDRLSSAAAACVQLGCGSAVSASQTEGSSSRPLWGISSSCVRTASVLKECVLMNDTTRTSLSLTVICSELLARPNISLSYSTDGVSQAEQQGFWVLIGSTFGIMCSVEPQYQGGSFQLMFTSSNTAQNYTLPAVNHSALFLFSAADHTHRGTYTCVYHNHVWSRDFSSVSQPRSLAVLAPLTELIIRVTVVLLAMMSSITAICCYYKPKLD